MSLDTRLVALRTDEKCITLLVRGQHFATYRFGGGGVPGFTALYAPEARRITRVDDSGLALHMRHGNVNGISFGAPTCDRPAGRIISRDIAARRGSQSVGFRHRCDWRGPDDTLALTEFSTVRALPGPGTGAVLDLDIRLVAPNERPISFGQTDDSLLVIRAANAICAGGTGQVRNSRDDYGSAAIHGRQASWCACVGVVLGATVGFAFLDHPTNPYHPSPWNCRADGSISPSPFAWQAQELAPGQQLRLRYRLHIHEGYVETGWAEERLSEFARE